MKTFPRLPIIAAVIGALVAAVGLIASTATSYAATIETGAWYQIVSRHSGKAITICSNSTADGACVQQFTRNASQQSQQFRFVDAGSGYYRIQARHSGKVLDVFERSTANGADIVQWTDNNGTNQQFQVVDTTGDYVKIVNRRSGKALDVWERSTADGARISQYDDTGGNNQQWQLVKVDGGGSQQPPAGARQMENLGRGVVAVRSSNTQVLVTWRLLGLDPEGIGFNVYRSANNGSWTRLNNQVLTGGTNYTDSTANPSQSNSYRVAPVLNGTEQSPSAAFTLRANNPVEPVVRVPLRNGGPVKFIWAGDLTGNGEYDYVIDRQTAPQRLEAYTGTGQFLWQVNMGPNSMDQNNIEGGSSTINVGHNDGVTVYDFDGDGRAEVAVRIANGVVFGDGRTFNHSNNNHQFIAILDGRTGALRASAQVPTDYLHHGPMYARFGVGHLDGVKPSLVAYMKNRQGGAGSGFNLMMSAWDFDGTNVRMKWKWLRGNQNAPDGHQTRIIDVNGDGKDEVVEIGFVLNGDGTLRYSMGPQGVVHGDRFHIADMDPSRPGLEGYAVQQDNPNGLREYYYDAATGQIIWRHTGSPADIGRGMAGDIDSRYPGMEVWSFDGLYNAPTNQLTQSNRSHQPWPALGLWWDGDLGLELLNDGKLEKWNPNSPTGTGSVPRLVTTWNYGAVRAAQGMPMLVGDLFGDWREEAVYTNSSYNELIIFTTDRPTNHRIYTLAHNPAYRNAMTLKGYLQSHHVDYFLGYGMSTPPRPNITY